MVGHSGGGACVSYALEHFPEKISKAVFLCATMVSDGQKPFDAFAEQVNNHHKDFYQKLYYLIHFFGYLVCLKVILRP